LGGSLVLKVLFNVYIKFLNNEINHRLRKLRFLVSSVSEICNKLYYYQKWFPKKKPSQNNQQKHSLLHLIKKSNLQNNSPYRLYLIWIISTSAVALDEYSCITRQQHWTTSRKFKFLYLAQKKLKFLWFNLIYSNKVWKFQFIQTIF